MTSETSMTTPAHRTGRTDHIVIAMDGHGNVSFGDEQEFETLDIAQRECDRRNEAAEANGSDWFYMPQSAELVR